MPSRTNPHLVASLLCFAVLLLAGTIPAQDAKKEVHPVVADFLKYFKKAESDAKRDLVERMVKVQTPEGVEILIKHALSEKDYSVREQASSVLSRMAAPAAQAAVLAGLDSRKENVREGIAIALGSMKFDGDPPVERICAVIEKDRSTLVRSACAEALGNFGSTKATPTLCGLMDERDEALVIAAADAMAVLKDPVATPSLIPLLQHGSWRVQVAALHALGKMRPKDAVQPIITYLDQADGRPREDARRALVRITLRTFGMNATTWQEWWDRVEDTWTVPPEKKVEDEDPGRGYSRKPVRYHRLTTFSDKLLFVIDVSSSMEDVIELKAGVKKGKTGRANRYSATEKIAIAREELAFCLRGLKPETKFNVIAFETDIRWWKKEPVPASSGNVQGAIRWIMKQKARKPSANRMGVVSSGKGKYGMTIGRTNSYGALRAIFGFKGRRGEKGRTTRSHSSRAPKPKWDTTFFLSDGQPTEGEVTLVPEILEEVRTWNKSAKMIIHTIGMSRGGTFTQLMDGLAQITGGKSVYLGK